MANFLVPETDFCFTFSSCETRFIGTDKTAPPFVCPMWGILHKIQ